MIGYGHTRIIRTYLANFVVLHVTEAWPGLVTAVFGTNIGIVVTRHHATFERDSFSHSRVIKAQRYTNEHLYIEYFIIIYYDNIIIS